jgi:hypothetical protein
VADLQSLLQRLTSIEAACLEARWEDAEALMQEHDRALREVPTSDWTRDALQSLLDRQQQLAQLMRTDRDSASAELAQFSASKRGAQAYRK